MSSGANRDKEGSAARSELTMEEYGHRFGTVFIGRTDEKPVTIFALRTFLDNLAQASPGFFLKDRAVVLLDVGPGGGLATAAVASHVDLLAPRGSAPHAIDRDDFFVNLTREAMNKERGKVFSATGKKGEKARIVQGNGFDKDDLTKLLDGKNPDIVLVSHAAYYAQDPTELMKMLSGLQEKGSLLISVHEGHHSLNEVKKEFGTIPAESEHTVKLSRYFGKEARFPSFMIPFTATIAFPSDISDDAWEDMRRGRRRAKDAAFTDTKGLLEFFTHRALDRMPPDEREKLVEQSRALIEKEDYTAQSYNMMHIGLPHLEKGQGGRISHRFVEEVRAAVNATKEALKAHGLAGNIAFGSPQF